MTVKLETTDNSSKNEKPNESIATEPRNYGNITESIHDEIKKYTFTKIPEVPTHSGETVRMLVRIATIRQVRRTLIFVVFRKRYNTIQGVVSEKNTSIDFINFVNTLTSESVVWVVGVVTDAKLIQSCTIQQHELNIREIYLVTASLPRLPFPVNDQPQDGSSQQVLLETRLDNRVIDLRRSINQSIFSIRSAITRLFREFLVKNNFMEINTPKLIAGSSEGGANVFTLPYFKKTACLAQSPQLYKQMCICGDFEQVFEEAPVFRAENSLTHRHMTEFIGMDIEMEIVDTYHEAIYRLHEMFYYIFEKIQEECAEEIKILDMDSTIWPPKITKEPFILTFKEGIALLREAGVELEDLEDLSTANERKLGEIVHDKYNVDFYCLDKFPKNARPFYTMPCSKDPNYTNSYDFFIYGEEILSGAQRLHSPEEIINSAKAHGMNPDLLEGYINSFRYGVFPHAGGGIGLDRVVMLFLRLSNIRRATLFPRDPHRLTP